MDKQVSLRLAVLVVVAAASAWVTWHFASAGLRRGRVDEGLAPISALLKDNQQILEALAADGYPQAEAAILERYLADIRRDGVPKRSATAKRIDTLVANDTVISALLAIHAGSLRTPEFRLQAEKYREFATALHARWHATFETFMAGGSLDKSGLQRPDGFAGALEAEIAAQ